MELVPVEIFEQIGRYLTIQEYQNLRIAYRNNIPKTQTVGWNLYKSQVVQNKCYFDWIRIEIHDFTVDSFLYLLEKRQFHQVLRLLRHHHILSTDILEIGLISLTHSGPLAIPIAQAIYDIQRITNYSSVFSVFCALGMTDIVQELLQKSIDPTDSGRHFAIVWPCRNGHVGIVKLLLNDKRVDPSMERNWPIQAASTNNHPDIVQLLLKDERVDPSADRNTAIHQAQIYGHFQVISVLLEDPRVNPFQQSSNIIEKSFVNHQFEVVEKLLLHPQFRYFYLQELPDSFIVSFLEKVQSTVNPQLHINWSLRYAASKGLTSFINCILNQTIVTQDLLRDALNEATRANHTQITKLLNMQIYS
jgi:ankyrin repeat protein